MRKLKARIAHSIHKLRCWRSRDVQLTGIAQLSPSERADVLNSASASRASELLEELDEFTRHEALHDMSHDQRSAIKDFEAHQTASKALHQTLDHVQESQSQLVTALYAHLTAIVFGSMAPVLLVLLPFCVVTGVRAIPMCI